MKLSILRSMSAVLLCLLFGVVMAADAPRAQRPMKIQKVEQLGLEIWTEVEPEWETRVERGKNSPTFVAETPALTYPPAAFSWVRVKGMSFADGELKEGARGAFDAAARNYGLRSTSSLQITAASYGVLTGYETQFSSTAYGTDVDVKLFFGHQHGKDAVLIHATTLKGKMPHLSEQIRRSWTNTKYLP